METIKPYIFAFILLSLFFAVISLGWSEGRKKEESKLVYSQTLQLRQALENFFSDNQRFPTADEFARVDVMKNYLNRIPASSDIADKNCPQAFSYERPQTNNFILTFCLPSGVNGYKAGFNKITVQK